MSGTPHPEDVRETWGRYAAKFSSEEADEEHRPPMRRLIELCGPSAGAFVLDVATGAGFTAFAFARRGCRVVALDPTHEMLLATLGGWVARSLRGDALVVEAWAERLPFRDGTFDAVVSHRAPHQFADVGAFVREAARVLRPEGVLGVADQAPADGWEDWHNDLERLRDPTHARAMSLREWRPLVEEAGLRWEAAERVGQPQDVERWIERVSPPPDVRERILTRIADMPDSLRSWYQPTEEGGRFVMQTPHAVFVARRLSS